MQRRFLDALAEQGGSKATALPDRFRPLARSLAGRPILVSHDAASRAALRAVDRPAATLGNVVHLQRSPDSSPDTMEVLAHELVHAASAPTAPRFFGEPDRDHEEHRAHQVGRVARQASVERIDPASLPLGKESVVLPRIIQRTTDAPESSAAASRALSGMSGSGASSAVGLSAASPSVQRAPSGSSSTSGGPSGQAIDHTAGGYTAEVFGGSGGVAGMVQRAMQDNIIRRDPSGGADLPSGLAADSDISTSLRLNQLDELIELIERRVINELERRGGRVRGLW